MTDQIETPVETDEEDSELAPSPHELNPSLRRCQFTMTLSTYDVESLREGLDVAALNLGRYGLSAFFVTATDPDTGDQWVVQDGERVYPMAEFEAMANQDDDPALDEAAGRMVAAQLEEINDDRPDTTS